MCTAPLNGAFSRLPLLSYVAEHLTLSPSFSDFRGLVLSMDDQHQSNLITITVVVCIVMSLSAVTLRVITRRVHKISLGADDYCIFIGTVKHSHPHRVKQANDQTRFLQLPWLYV